jgi:tetratricopeptide (TPR) repeat protein
MTDDHFTASPSNIGSNAGWHVIHSGKELGPFTLDVLVEKAATGEIAANDLVKQAGGLWTKASDFEFLQEQFGLRASRQEALERLGRFHGIWISRNALVMSGCVVLFLVSFAVASWAIIRRPTSDAVERDAKIRDNPHKPAADIAVIDARIAAMDARFYFDRGLTSHKNGKYDNAIKDFDEAIRLDPIYAEAFLSRGLAWRFKFDYELAIHDYNEAIRINPNLMHAYLLRGHVWRAKNDYKGSKNAINDYDEAIRLDPNCADAFLFRGFAWSDQKDYDNAIQDYNEAIRINPNDARAFNFRGYAWSHKKDYDNAIKDFDESIRRNPNDAGTFYSRGQAWRDKGHNGKATKDFDEASRLDPTGFPPR